MNHVDLFSGIGGFALAAKWTWGNEYENLGHSEIESFPCKVYHKHFPESKCLGDITKIDWTGYAGRIDLLTGGFPCQPFSVAGKRKGKEDDRWLWHEMFRAVREAKPRWVIGENVTGIINVALDQVLSEMEGEGYTTETFIIPACAVNAPHRRDRVWFVAHPGRSGTGSIGGEIGNEGRSSSESRGTRIRQTHGEISAGRTSSANSDASDATRRETFSTEQGGLHAKSRGKNRDVGNADSARTQSITEAGGSRNTISESIGRGEPWNEHWYEVATRLCRVDDGVSNRVDRLKGLGNAIVPAVVVPIMEAIKAQWMNKMDVKRLHHLRTLLSQDDDIAKIEITSEELTEIWKYQQSLVRLWTREYSIKETINVMVRDLETPREVNR